MKLSVYLAEKKMKRRDFAKQINVSQGYVSMICNGQIWPGHEIIQRIATATGGAVLANDFMDPPARDAEAARLTG